LNNQIGMPFIFWMVLRRYRQRLHEPEVRIQVGFLYEAYQLDAWWFELIDMLHKLAVTSLLAFLPGKRYL
jgi:hypothetical protein